MYKKYFFFFSLFLLFNLQLYSFDFPQEPDLDADCETWIEWEENCISSMPADSELAVDWIGNCLEVYQRALRHKESIGQPCDLRFRVGPGSFPLAPMQRFPLAPVQRFGENRSLYEGRVREWREQCRNFFAVFINKEARQRGIGRCEEFYNQAMRSENVDHVQIHWGQPQR